MTYDKKDIIVMPPPGNRTWDLSVVSSMLTPVLLNSKSHTHYLGSDVTHNSWVTPGTLSLLGEQETWMKEDCPSISSSPRNQTWDLSVVSQAC